MKVLKLLVAIVVLNLFHACTGINEATPIELVRYVNKVENGLNQKKRIGNVEVAVKHKPLSYVISNDLRRNDITKKEYDAKNSQLSGLQYYNLELDIKDTPGVDITNVNVTDREALQERLYYLSFHMKHDIKLVQGQDTLAPVLYHFERSYDVSNHRTFVLAFEENAMNNAVDKTFVLDSPILGTGPVKLTFKEEDLKSVPQIKLL